MDPSIDELLATALARWKQMDVRFGTFIDFVAADWAAKITCIKQAKNRYGQDYDPATDYWKAMRQGIVELHQRRLRPSHLDNVVAGLSDPRKAANHTAAAAGYKRWLGRHAVHWAGCPSIPWTSGPLTVHVNPELGVVVDGQLFAIKLWLRAGSKLTKKRIDACLRLLEVTHGTSGAEVGILDVRHANLITPTRAIPGIDALLAGEAAAFAQMWTSL